MEPYEFIWFGAMDVTKPYEFIGFGAMDVTKPYEFIGFGAMHSQCKAKDKGGSSKSRPGRAVSEERERIGPLEPRSSAPKGP